MASRIKLSSIVLSLFLLPSVVFAACSSEKRTVVYINGIDTSSYEATNEMQSLQNKFSEPNLNFVTAHNPTTGSLVGQGGLAQFLDGFGVTKQLLYWRDGVWNEDPKGDVILKELHDQLKTQQVMLVGHSQGALYANETYKYLIAHGLSAASVGNFDIATPASYVAGGGGYITSTNDTVINKVRSANKTPGFGAIRTPLPGNVAILFDSTDNTGHLFYTYLNGDSYDIVRGIESGLGSLAPTTNKDLGECFTAPDGSTLNKLGVSLSNITATLGTVEYAAAASLYNGTIAAAGTALDAAHQIIADVGTAVGGANGIAHAGEPKYESTNFNVANHVFGAGNQEVDGENVYQMLHEGDSSQGGAVILATVQDTHEAAPAPDTSAPTVPIGPAPGFSPGGGGSAPSSDSVAVSLPDTQSTVVDTSSATTTDATTTVAAPLPPPPAAEPVVINEVAWGGGYGAPNEQWIELYNNSDDEVSLDDIVLSNADGDMYIPLSGSIVAHGYYILASSENSIFNLRNSGWNYGASAEIALNSTPVQLVLSRINSSATTTLDRTPAADACGGSWCAGSAGATDGYAAAGGYPPMPVTMERINPNIAGTDQSNWANSDGYTYSANDKNRQRIIGTPNHANTSHWPMAGFICTGDLSVLTPGSSYTYRPASNTCHYLSGYVGRDLTAEGILLKGVVGSSTMVTRIGYGSGTDKDLQTDANHTYDFASANSGDIFTVVLYNYNNNVGGQYNGYYVGDMLHYLETGLRNDDVTNTAPYDYQTISFVIP